MTAIHMLAKLLVVVGALNWGLVGALRFDLVAALFGLSFGQVSPITAIVYGLVGLAGVYLAVTWWLLPDRGRELAHHVPR